MVNIAPTPPGIAEEEVQRGRRRKRLNRFGGFGSARPGQIRALRPDLASRLPEVPFELTPEDRPLFLRHRAQLAEQARRKTFDVGPRLLFAPQEAARQRQEAARRRKFEFDQPSLRRAERTRIGQIERFFKGQLREQTEKEAFEAALVDAGLAIDEDADDEADAEAQAVADEEIRKALAAILGDASGPLTEEEGAALQDVMEEADFASGGALSSPPPVPPDALTVASILTNIVPALARPGGNTAYVDGNAMAQDVLRTFEALVSTEAGFDNFLEDVYAKGRNNDTEFILDLLGVDQNEVDAFFEGAPPGQLSELEGTLQRIFPERDLDAVIQQALSENEEERSVFFEELREKGVTADTWAFVKQAFPELETVDIVEFFAHESTQPSNEFLAAIGDKVSGALQYTDGWWKVGLMEMGFGFQQDFRTLTGQEQFSSNAERILNNAFKEHGWRAIFSSDVSDAWDVYFQERGGHGTAQFVAEMSNPVYWLPWGGTAGLMARPLAGVAVVGPTMRAIARTIQFAELAPFKALGLAGRGAGVVLRPVRAGLEELTFQAEKRLLQRAPVGMRGGAGVNTGRFLLREIPTVGEMRAAMFPDDMFKAIAKKVPFLDRVAPATQIGTLPAQLSLNDPKLITQAIGEHAYMRQGLLDMGRGQKTNALAAMRELGTTNRLYGVNDLGIASSRRVAARNGTDSLALGDIVQAPERYIFEHTNGFEYAKRAQRLTDDAFRLAKSNGVDIKELQLEEFQEFVHWVVTGKVNKEGELIVKRAGGVGAQVGGPVSSFQHRRFTSMMEGIDAGIRYNNNLESYVGTYIDDMWKSIADKRFQEGVSDVVTRIEGSIPTDPIGRLNALYPGVEKNWTGVRKEMDDLAYILDNVQQTRRGGVLSGQTMVAIRRRDPGLAVRLDKALELGEKTIDKELTRFTKEVWERLKLSPAEFKETISTLRGVKIDAQHPVRAGEIDAALRFINADAKTSLRILKQIYSNTGANRSRILKDMSDDLFKRIADLRPRWNQALSQRAEKAALARSPRFGAKEGRINIVSGKLSRPHPAFQNQVYPEAIADAATKILNRDANQFLKFASNISGTGVLLQASMDLSAPGIQGLIPILAHPILSRKPIIKMIDAFLRPGSLDRYIAGRAATMNQRQFYGGLSSQFDVFESMGAIAKLAGKVPGGKFVLGQTYGRAQAAFSAFSLIYRDQMWELGSKAWIDAGKGGEFARILDRSVGLASFAQLGTPANLEAFLRGFVSFTPTYRLATASFLASAFKGGMTGAFVRKELARAVAMGVGMYTVWTRGLGIPAYLNPITDGKKFMSVQIGEHWYGIGGAIISFMRMFADVTASIASIGENEPMDFRTFDRWQNPLIRGWLTQAAPLSRMGLEAVNQHDFLGYPLETPQEWAEWAAENVTPIAAQDIFFDKSGVPITPLAVLGNSIGLRTSPETRWEAFNEQLKKEKVWEKIPDLTDEQIAKINSGDTILSVINRKQTIEMFEANPQIVEKYETAVRDALIRSSNEYKNYVATTESFKEDLRNSLTAALDVGVSTKGFSTLHLRDQYGDALDEYGSKLGAVAPFYQDLYDEWDESREKRKEDAEAFDLAYWEYIETVASPDRDIAGVGYDFEGYTAALEAFRIRWGQKVLDDIRFVLESNKDEVQPEWAVRLWKNRIELNEAGYWDLPSKATTSFTQNDLDTGVVPEDLVPVVTQLLAADIENRKAKRELDDKIQKARLVRNQANAKGSKAGVKAADAAIDLLKERKDALTTEIDPSLSVDKRVELRKSNTELDAILGFWHYGGKIQSQQAVDLMGQWAQELGIPFEALGGNLAPLDLIPLQFEYDELETANERIRFRTEHPAWDDYLVESKGFSPVGGRADTLIPENLVKIDAVYQLLSTDGKTRLIFRHRNPEYDAWLVAVKGFTPVGDRWK